MADDEEPVGVGTLTEPEAEPVLEPIMELAIMLEPICEPIMEPIMEPVGEAAAVGVADVLAGEPLELAPGYEAAHWHSAPAADLTWRPVTAPQAETTQLRASELMAANCEDEHWQAKSVNAQPTAEPAEVKHEVCGSWLARAS